MEDTMIKFNIHINGILEGKKTVLGRSNIWTNESHSGYIYFLIHTTHRHII